MFVNMPTPLTFPKNEFIFILTASIMCAFLSTYGPAKNLLKMSIPDISRFAWEPFIIKLLFKINQNKIN